MTAVGVFACGVLVMGCGAEDPVSSGSLEAASGEDSSPTVLEEESSNPETRDGRMEAGGDSEQVERADPLIEEVDEAVALFLESNPGLEGLAVLVLHKDLGILHRKAYGAFEEDRAYLVASSSKMVAAGVINKLHDEGILDMYAPVAEIAEWGTAHPEVSPVHLFSNSSGLPGLDTLTNQFQYSCQYVKGGNLKECSQSIFEAEINPEDTVIPPDTEFRYGGGQWQVLGGVAEVASGKSWNALLQDIYFEPCGLNSSGFVNQFEWIEEPFGVLEFTYPKEFDGAIENATPTDNPLIEAGMYTTMDDYGKLLMMHLKGGLCGETRIHPEETIERMHADRILEVYGGDTGFPGLEGYGMGWWVDRSEGSVVSDPGAYGSWPYIDETRGLAVLTLMEANLWPEGWSLYLSLRPVLESYLDEVLSLQ